MVVNLGLKVASVKNVLEVGAVAPSLHPTDSSVGEVIEPVAVRDLPLNGRMLIDLLCSRFPARTSVMGRRRGT
jgi:hypothetical protein